MTGHKKLGALTAKPSPPDLEFIKRLFEVGQVMPVIDRCYPLNEVPEALRYLEEGHARGKIVIQVK